ncbi:DUF3086 domain-containing protein [Pseudanabaena sp. FACHB-1998]|uniref:DUF3086 domain-containing protein n=1 Tax=Pseudanabaena sp. FACHB-1998 TaxID=2692858 RepID=UPI001680F28E|nr:DUF3086 domain-containing protein [Pseudanabaena sp. FACHB-1998]MBD2176278.1 DUF3086 domain-containing protein [Pseudanabaena sp. FACHB-1998]
MESDQQPVEVENSNFLNSSVQGESPEAIALSINLDESKTENTANTEDIADILEISTENLTSSSPEHNEVATSAPEVIADDVSQNEAEPEPLAPLLAIIEQLKQQETELKAELEHLKNAKTKILQDQIDDLQSGIIRLAQADVARLEYQKQELQAAIAVLEKRKDRLDKEMTSTYAGASQDIAVRVQGFKDYLVGSLQDLVASAEKLNLIAPPAKEVEPVVVSEKKPAKEIEPPLLSEQTFAEYKQRVDQLLERYRTLPDYYGPAWKLRRTFEQVHADRVSKWFFEQSGRGAIRTMGTRLQNILVTSAAISVLKAVYGEKLRVLVLATSPERLGEWRRGFQDCLGLTREHFGSDKGIALFEDPEPLATKGDRLVKEGLSPLVIIDESEELISVDLLRFPLLIAFGGAPDTKTGAPSSYINRDSNRDTPNNRDNRDYNRESTRDYPKDFSNDYAPKDQRNRDYGTRDYSSQNRDYGRDSGSYGGGNRSRNNQDSDWDW